MQNNVNNLFFNISLIYLQYYLQKYTVQYSTFLTLLALLTTQYYIMFSFPFTHTEREKNEKEKKKEKNQKERKETTHYNCTLGTLRYYI